jgi:hypothetical protein
LKKVGGTNGSEQGTAGGNRATGGTGAKDGGTNGSEMRRSGRDRATDETGDGGTNGSDSNKAEGAGATDGTGAKDEGTHGAVRSGAGRARATVGSELYREPAGRCGITAAMERDREQRQKSRHDTFKAKCK